MGLFHLLWLQHTDNAFAQLHDSLKAALDSELATTRIASAQFALGMAEQEVLDKEREIVLWQIQAKRVAEFVSPSSIVSF